MKRNKGGGRGERKGGRKGGEKEDEKRKKERKEGERVEGRKGRGKREGGGGDMTWEHKTNWTSSQGAGYATYERRISLSE